MIKKIFLNLENICVEVIGKEDVEEVIVFL